jgi:hypothetical protein
MENGLAGKVSGKEEKEREGGRGSSLPTEAEMTALQEKGKRSVQRSLYTSLLIDFKEVE